ncbi:MAG: RNA polymerase factor sigma-54 [Ignavibacteria bacterium]
MLKQVQSQKLSHKLIPGMVLNQNILAIPTLALENIIKKELELNPMLEEELENETEGSEEVLVEIDEPVIADKEENSEETDSENTEEDITVENKIDEEYDWDEYFENESEDYKTYESNDTVQYDNNNLSESSTSLLESLLLQIHLSELNNKLTFAGEEILRALNADGYFTDNFENIIADLEVKKLGTDFENEDFTIPELNETLTFIQNSLDPAGIAARNLIECLLLQIDRSEKSKDLKSLAKSVVENHLEDLRLKRYENISKALKIELDKVNEIFEFIHKLNPKPGFIDTSSKGNYIIPDLIVKKVDETYEIFLNEKYTPSIRLNKTYRDLYKNEKASLDKETKEYIVNNFNRAKWFLDAINSRRETMLKVMGSIIDKQKDFFDSNGEGLKPMYEKDVAEVIKMDPSTISRTVRGKYVQTDFGIYELRSFFTTPLQTNNGEDVSNTEVKIKLKEFIDNENKSKPLTDEELAAELKNIGFRIARRTVAKYREAIHLPVAKLRREIKIN